jgi:hypothetical protein
LALRWAAASALLVSALVAVLARGMTAEARSPESGSLSGARAAGQPALRVIPFPGTPDASPQSHIIFPALRPSEIRSMSVTGSSSGAHSGQRSKLPDHGGTAFLPARPFSPGETVTVQANLTSPQAGTASGDPGATVLHFSFTVAIAGGPSSSGAAQDQSGAASTASQRPAVSFHSRPGLHPPAVAGTSDPDRGSGDIFITSPARDHGISQFGPLILNPQGKLVWFRHVSHTPYNLQVQHYRGQRVLTWWQGTFLGKAEDVILNQSYRTIGVVRGAEGYHPDLHEFQITPQGTALVDSYSTVQANLTSVGGPSNGRVTDCIIQELDIRTGKLLWEWHALGHVPLTDSYDHAGSGSARFDFFHMNSIQQLSGGDLLISARNTWAIYKINPRTGKIIWTLGGRHSNFRMGPGTNFEWQHDARLSGQRLSLFDDGAWPQEEPQSSAKLLRIDQTRRTAVLLQRYRHSPPLLAPRGGSMEVLPNGNVFVGWGATSNFSEYSHAGHQLFNGTTPLYASSYRALRFPWTGRPRDRPALALSRSRNGTTWLYVSWNGATQVAQWRVLGGPSAHRLAALKTRPWHSFETAIALPGAPRHLAVQALDAHGHALGRSAVMTRPRR